MDILTAPLVLFYLRVLNLGELVNTGLERKDRCIQRIQASNEFVIYHSVGCPGGLLFLLEVTDFFIFLFVVLKSL